MLKNNAVFIICLLLICATKHIYAYNGPYCHKFMGERAAEESNLDTYLKENLGFSKGMDTKFGNTEEDLPEEEQKKTAKEWIGYGGIMEDEPWSRCDNHFYDPVTNQGLSDNPHWFPVSSIIWAMEHQANIFSWAQAREYYYLALTSSTKEEREKYWALTFRALGQVLHLVQDLGVPAHVRNDNHGPLGNFPYEWAFWDPDPYESWSVTEQGLPFIKTIMLLGKFEDENYLYPVVEVDQFDDYWDTETGQGFAEFTNSNFVSKDTNLDKMPGDPYHYDSPQRTGLHVEPYTFTDSNGVRRTVNVLYCTSNVVDNYASDKSVNPFNYLTAVSYWDFYTFREDPEKRVYTLNSKCHEEYAKLLIPRTVGYSAGLLDYFFRGKIDVSFQLQLDEDNCNYIINISNRSDELISGGSLEIHYYNDNYASGIIPITESTYFPSNGLLPNESCTVTIGAYPSYVKYIIIFKECTLGVEDNVTIGKVVNRNIFFQYHYSTVAKKEKSFIRDSCPYDECCVEYDDVLTDNPYYNNTSYCLRVGQSYWRSYDNAHKCMVRYSIFRSYPQFFTSSIPDDAIIKSANFYMKTDASDSENLPWTLEIYNCNIVSWGAGMNIVEMIPMENLISQPYKVINISPSAINKSGVTIFEMKCSKENAPLSGIPVGSNEHEVMDSYSNWLAPHYNYLLIDWEED